MKRIVILGNGVVGNLCALFLHRQLGDRVEIVVVGPRSRGGLPVVGESLIEISSAFLEERLGLGEYLRTHHNPKFGLTYYFQVDPSDPDKRRYSVHQNEAAPVDTPPLPGWDSAFTRPPAWLINREVFDADMQRFVDEAGIERMLGVARDVTIVPDGLHQIEVKCTDGERRSLKADWLIDTTGRNRFLGKRLNLTQRSEGQRNCLWFHLRDFDPSHLSNIDALGPMPPGPGEYYHYDRYFTTHHFFGKGNWIWAIPIRTPDGSNQISIGLTSHPEHFVGKSPTNIESLIDHVRTEHHALADLIESGTAHSVNNLRNYHYSSSRLYSRDRWCILGDAAYALDPLFSNGLAFSVLQLEQVHSMIEYDLAGSLEADYVDRLSEAMLGPINSSQDAISDWYGTMDDPFLANLRLYWIEISYFYGLLPAVKNRCYVDPDKLSLWLQLFNSRNSRTDRFDLPRPLRDARSRMTRPSPEHFIYMGAEKVNPRALEQVDDIQDLFPQFRAGSKLRSELTRRTLKRVDTRPTANAEAVDQALTQ